MVQQLSSRERAFLRKLAHNLEPIVRIGKEGIDENVLKLGVAYFVEYVWEFEKELSKEKL